MAAAAAVCWALTWFLFSQTPYGAGRGGLSLTLVFGSLAAACVAGASAGSPFGDAERTSARPLAPARFLHLSGLLSWSSLVLCGTLLLFDLDGARPEYPLLVLVRNVAALGGVALLSAGLIGPRAFLCGNDGRQGQRKDDGQECDPNEPIHVCASSCVSVCMPLNACG